MYITTQPLCQLHPLPWSTPMFGKCKSITHTHITNTHNGPHNDRSTAQNKHTTSWIGMQNTMNTQHYCTSPQPPSSLLSQQQEHRRAGLQNVPEMHRPVGGYMNFMCDRVTTPKTCTPKTCTPQTTPQVTCLHPCTTSYRSEEWAYLIIIFNSGQRQQLQFKKYILVYC